ncbi:RNA polymerase III transcription factor IIIC subunit-domain-containing protein [Fennellomyces sp. T-0311]|nr:RNA polymerase III transcription factor IIIC subunit-domain-containing protein [Fennellomyces sp. T-0311]
MDQTFNLNLPNRKFVLVEYPGRVKNVQRAIQTLGGEKKIANTLNKDIKTLELKYRPEDPFSHPISGDVISTAAVVLKITKRKKKSQPDEEATYKAEAIGTVPRSCRFRAMADFQYLVPKDNKLREFRSSLEKGNVNDILNFNPNEMDKDDKMIQIPPPVFSMRETPFDYGYNQNAPVLRVRVRQRDGSYAIKLVNRFRRSANEICSILFEAETVPDSPKFDVSILKKDEKAVCDIVAKLFEERPVWTRLGVMNMVDLKHHRYLKSALNANAYAFRSGPFRDCWVRYGVDPRKDKKYYIYQIVNVRGFVDSQQGRSQRGARRSVYQRKKAPEEKSRSQEERLGHQFDGMNIPTKTAVLLVTDIVDPELQDILHNPKFLKPVCTKTSGFYYDCVLDRLRALLKQKMSQMKEKGKAKKLMKPTEGLAEPVAKEKEEKKYTEKTPEADDLEKTTENKELTKEDKFAETLRQIQGFNFGSMDMAALEEFDFDDLLGEDGAEVEDFDGEEHEEQEDKPLWELDDLDL